MATTSKNKSTTATKTTPKASASKATAKPAADTKKKSTAKAAAPKATAKKAASGNGAEKAKSQTKSKRNADTMVTHDMIASKAYHIWANNGYPHGMDMQNWLQAEKELQTNA